MYSSYETKVGLTGDSMGCLNNMDNRAREGKPIKHLEVFTLIRWLPTVTDEMVVEPILHRNLGYPDVGRHSDVIMWPWE